MTAWQIIALVGVVLTWSAALSWITAWKQLRAAEAITRTTRDAGRDTLRDFAREADIRRRLQDPHVFDQEKP